MTDDAFDEPIRIPPVRRYRRRRIDPAGVILATTLFLCLLSAVALYVAGH